MDRHVETDDPAVAVPENRGALDPQHAHELDHVLGHVVIVERTIDVFGGAPMSHQLDHDHLEPVGEIRDRLREILGRPRSAVQHRDAPSPWASNYMFRLLTAAYDIVTKTERKGEGNKRTRLQIIDA